MPFYSPEQLLDSALDRINPGSRILMKSFHHGPQGGVTSLKGLRHESLYHGDGKKKIMCGFTRMGDKHACS